MNKTRWCFIFGIFFLLLCACSGNNKEQEVDLAKVMEGRIENSIRYKIDLLCLKYDISSESIKQELVNFIKSQDLMLQTAAKGKQSQNNKEEEVDYTKETILRLLMQREELDIDKLKLMSAKHNVPGKTLANLLYDYEIWDSIESIER